MTGTGKHLCLRGLVWAGMQMFKAMIACVIVLCNILVVHTFRLPMPSLKIGRNLPTNHRSMEVQVRLTTALSKTRPHAFSLWSMETSIISEKKTHETDFVVIGSGLGGLTAAALLVILSEHRNDADKVLLRTLCSEILRRGKDCGIESKIIFRYIWQSKYGNNVTVCESHYLPGGCAHGFEIRAKQGGGIFRLHFTSIWKEGLCTCVHGVGNSAEG